MKKTLVRAFSGFVISFAAIQANGIERTAPAVVKDSRVEAIVQRYVADGRFSGVVFVQDKLQQIHLNSYGYAVREYEVLNTPNSVFRLGSLSKQFVAAFILRLQEQNKIGLNDPISKFLSVPASWDKITVRQLLTHTSGLPEEFPLAADPSTDAAFHTPEQLLASAQNLVPSLATGTTPAFLYSNLGYSLLAMIVAKVTGAEYPTQVEQFLGHQLHLPDTRVSHDALIVPRLAFGYVHGAGSEDFRACCSDLSNLLGAGDLHSTVEDLSRWLDILLEHSFLRSDSLEAMWAPQVKMESAGRPIEDLFYGYGWTIDQRKGRRVISHDGSVPGYSADLAWLPREHARIIVLSNIRNIIPAGNQQVPEDTASLIRFEIAHALFNE